MERARAQRCGSGVGALSRAPCNGGTSRVGQKATTPASPRGGREPQKPLAVRHWPLQALGLAQCLEPPQSPVIPGHPRHQRVHRAPLKSLQSARFCRAGFLHRTREVTGSKKCRFCRDFLSRSSELLAIVQEVKAPRLVPPTSHHRASGVLTGTSQRRRIAVDAERRRARATAPDF
jgi:hypothetical protein